MSEVTGIGTGSKTHQIMQMTQTAAVIAKALLASAVGLLLISRYTSTASNGPANRVMLLMFTFLIDIIDTYLYKPFNEVDTL